MFGKVLKIFGGAFLAIIIIIAGLWAFLSSSTADTEALADQFVQHLSEEKIAPAYALLHKNLKRKMTAEQFKQLVYRGQLHTVTMVNWTGMAVNDGVESVSGEGTTASGVEVEVEIKATDIDNDDTLGILAFDFEQAD